VDAGTFLKHLRQSRLLGAEELQAIQDRCADRAGGEEVASELVDEGVLTPFQARRLCAGASQHLVLGQYRLLEELGRGGMGSVYKALHTFMGRTVAIKVILPELMKNDLVVEWFRREVRAVTQLHHPNIVMAYDANEADGLHFLVMEHVAGSNLDARVKTEGPLNVLAACELMREAAQGLQYAHEKGLVHRDIKPGNLLLPLPVPVSGNQSSLAATPSGPALPAVKIVDFGLARLHRTGAPETIFLQGHGEFLGTPDYCSPEQSRDIHAADIRSDLYSLGCTFYFALTGRAPFVGETAMEKLIKHLTEEPLPIQQVRPEVPASVAAIVRRLMAKSPADRYQVPADLAADLANCASGLRLRVIAAANKMSPAKRSGGGAPIRHPTPEQSTTNRLGPVPVSASDLRGDGFRSRAATSIPQGPAVLEAPECSGTDVVGPQAPPSSRSTPCPAVPTVVPELTPVVVPTVLLERGAAAMQQRPLPDLIGPWRAWTEVIGAFVARVGLSRLHPEKYREIYQQVLDACRAHAAAQPGSAELYQRLEAIVRPWLTLKTLQQTEQAIIDALYRQSKLAEWELSGGGPGPVSPGMWALLVFLVIVPAALTLWFRTGGERWLASLEGPPTWAWLRGSLHSFAVTMNQAPMYWLIGFVPAVLLFSILALRRPRRH
jgi:serine/threonine-protein kinase